MTEHSSIAGALAAAADLSATNGGATAYVVCRYSDAAESDWAYLACLKAAYVPVGFPSTKHDEVMAVSTTDFVKVDQRGRPVPIICHSPRR